MSKKVTHPKQTWVSPHPDGGWQVKKDYSVKAFIRTLTQKAAIKRARKIARNERGELVIQATDGKIREKNSVKTA
jgi:hypothetical protein